MIHKLLYLVGTRYRNPSLLPYFNFLLKSDKWTAEQLATYQFDKCKKLLMFAQKYSLFYKEYFAKIDFDAANVQSIDDLRKIPAIDKSILLKYNKEIHTNFDFKKLFF